MRLSPRFGAGLACCGGVLVVWAGVCGPAAADGPPAPDTHAEPEKLEPLPPAPLLLETMLRGLFEAVPERALLDDIKRRLADRNREAVAAAQHRQFVRQQAQQFEQLLQPLLRVELALVRHTCASLPAEARQEVLAAARQAVRELAERVARRQVEGQGPAAPLDVRLLLHEKVAAALEPLASREEFAAYQTESRKRLERRAETARLRIVAKLDQQLGLTTAQRDDVLADLRTHWEADWIRELENHDGVMINDRPPAPDFAAAWIVPHLDEVQRTQWQAWSQAAGSEAVPRGSIDWSDLNTLQQSPQRIDAWWRP